MVPKLPEIIQNSLARAQRAVHWTNTTSLPQANSRDYTHLKLWTRALMWTIHGHNSFQNSKGENAKCCPQLPQALISREDVTIGIPHSRLLGRKWRCVGVERPSVGKSVTNPALESALPTKVNFTQKEWAAFGIAHLQFDDYIMSNSEFHAEGMGCFRHRTLAV